MIKNPRSRLHHSITNWIVGHTKPISNQTGTKSSKFGGVTSATMQHEGIQNCVGCQRYHTLYSVTDLTFANVPPFGGGFLVTSLTAKPVSLGAARTVVTTGRTAGQELREQCLMLAAGRKLNKPARHTQHNRYGVQIGLSLDCVTGDLLAQLLLLEFGQHTGDQLETLRELERLLAHLECVDGYRALEAERQTVHDGQLGIQEHVQTVDVTRERHYDGKVARIHVPLQQRAHKVH
mmetsp:Transcript_9964/g.24866  ORF Transcript_9964/g.24866 Transcript_9964/m.24866 type:complete len:235 (+) Transcript_9964:623-1327(+)